ncbi:MAG: hypothetical protein E2O53_08825 [Gammaproteobacteria bacterium]|nr:MAG: hypothetical protein E2O53_08825 [Gammaproteobacteria bacterium]
MEAAIFFDSYLPAALRRAMDYAGDDGFVASMPQLLHARANAPYDNIIWNTWFNPNSEESMATTPQGNHVVVTVHGGGIFGSPERFEKLFRANTSRFSEVGFTGLFAGKITATEAHDLLNGRLPDGTEIPVYSFDEFNRGVADLPRHYAVVMDFERAKNCRSGYEDFDDLKSDPLMIVRAGGVEAAAKYLDKARNRHNTATMGSWHPFNSIKDLDQPQTRVPNLAGNKGGVGTEEEDGHLYGYDAEYGMGGDSSIHNTSMINVARYVAVAPRDASTSVRYLPFTA